MSLRGNFDREKKQDRFFQELINFCRQHKFFQPGEKILVACSGGLDSSVLLHSLFRVTRLFEITLQVAHVDHKTRGAASEREGTWVRVLAERLHLPFHALSLAAPVSSGGQAEFRKQRRAQLESKARELGCQHIALAHHASDNVETLLMRMMSGTGLYGLGSIRPQSGTYVRPLLWATRQDLVDYAKIHNLSWIEDPTNQEDNYLRNRIRHDLIPMCETLRQGSLGNLSKLAQRAGEEESEMEDWVTEQLSGTPAHILPLSALERFPKAIQRRIFRVWLKRQGVGEDVQLLEGLLRGDERVHPAGSFLKRSDSWIFYNEKDFGDVWASEMELVPSRRLTLGSSIAWSFLPCSSRETGRAQTLALLANFRSPMDSLKLGRRVFTLDIAWEKCPWPLGVSSLAKMDREAAALVTEVFLRHRIPEGYRRSWPLLVSLKEPRKVIGVVGVEVLQNYQPKTLERRVSIEHLLDDYLSLG
jgi:tRNA(Ile)-lysidine synthase